METKEVKDYIKTISKSSAYFIFRNGPVKKLYEEGKLTDEEIKEMQEYLQNHLAYLYNVLLEENNIQKFDLITSTMSKFYVNDDSVVELKDDGFDNFFESLFNPGNNKNSGLKLKK